MLDAFVRRDGSLPGFSGKVSVGIRGPAGSRWWCACFASRAHTEFSARPAPDSDVAVLVPEEEAEAMLKERRMPGPGSGVHYFGRMELLERMLARYATTQNWLQLRLSRGNR